jgi:hypothetical protein
MFPYRGGFMKRFLLCLVIPLSLFSTEVKEGEFKYLMHLEIKAIDKAIMQLSHMDPSDAYTYYWLVGMKEGLFNALAIFDDCIIERSGCDCDNYTLSISGE